ncbi:MAG TPA: copper resistance protein CopC [Actinomycetota bacterium]|nr:copper resistance protein CopC [Actinomycetota bacterium]
MIRRAGTVGAAALFLALALPHPAGAHALLASSTPAEGARLTEAPGEVVLRFTEAPEPSLTSVTLLDRTGAPLEAGEPAPVPGDPRAVSVSLPDLEQDVYTVTWRTVSRVDGHPSAGTFAFGVGVSPVQVAPAQAPAVETPDPSPLEMAGRLILFVGLAALVGAAWVGAVAFREIPPGVRRLAGAAWVVSAIGLVVLGIAQQRAAGATVAEFLPTAPGRALLFRAGAIVLAGTGLLAARLWPTAARRAFLLAGVAAAGAILAHVTAGHAAARGDLAWAKVLAQWVHVVAVGVWLGGLAALLIGIRGRAGEATGAAVRRFSAVAAYALAAVAVTGVVRAVNEVGSWGALFSTGYGRLVLVKAGLLLGLASLGAVNRYRNVPRATTSVRGLRRVSSGELTLALVALGAAAILATLVPPAQVPAEARAPAAFTAFASDFATSVRARLDVDPALPGPNRFSLRLRDYDTGEPIEAQRVSLRFEYIGAEAAESTLDLRPAERGQYMATGSPLSVSGLWGVHALVQRGADAVEIPFLLATECSAVRIPGEFPEPTVHLVEIPGRGSVEGYLLRLGKDRYEVHFTFLGEDGKPLPVEGSPTILATRIDGEPPDAMPATPDGAGPQELRTLFLSRGHYFSFGRLEPGTWRFDGAASGEGTSVAGCFQQTLGD